MRIGIARSGLPSRVSAIGLGWLLLKRALLTGVLGVALGLAAFGLSRMSGGLLGAGAFVLVLFTVPLTAGMMIAVVCAAWRARAPGFNLGQQRLPSRHRSAARAWGRCGMCRRRMVLVGDIWICPTCDRVAVES